MCELALSSRFDDFTEVGASHHFRHPQFQNSIVNTVVKAMFRDAMSRAYKPVPQIRIAIWNIARLERRPKLWGKSTPGVGACWWKPGANTTRG